jgi:hypothetical protein
VAALAASLAALAAVATAVMVSRQMRQDTQRILLSTALDAVWHFDVQWNSADMAAARAAAAAALLDGQASRDVGSVLDFFDQIAVLVSRGALDEEMVWHAFYRPMASYWFASQAYVRQVQRDDPAVWEELGRIMPRLVAIEAQRQKRTVDVAVPRDAEIREFLRAELDSGECAQDQEPATQKVPL